LSAYFIIALGVLTSVTGFSYHKYYGLQESSRLKGLIALFIGLIILLAVKKYYKGRNEPIEYSKCPQCGESYFYSKLSKGICPTCNVATIDLDKYYDKHN